MEHSVEGSTRRRGNGVACTSGGRSWRHDVKKRMLVLLMDVHISIRSVACRASQFETTVTLRHRLSRGKFHPGSCHRVCNACPVPCFIRRVRLVSEIRGHRPQIYISQRRRDVGRDGVSTDNTLCGYRHTVLAFTVMVNGVGER